MTASADLMGLEVAVAHEMIEIQSDIGIARPNPFRSHSASSRF